MKLRSKRKLSPAITLLSSPQSVKRHRRAAKDCSFSDDKRPSQHSKDLETQDSPTSLPDLGTDALLYIAGYLSLASAAALTITSRLMYDSIGPRYLRRISKANTCFNVPLGTCIMYLTEDGDQRQGFLMNLLRDLPGFEYCSKCLKLYDGERSHVCDFVSHKQEVKAYPRPSTVALQQDNIARLVKARNAAQNSGDPPPDLSHLTGVCTVYTPKATFQYSTKPEIRDDKLFLHTEFCILLPENPTLEYRDVETVFCFIIAINFFCLHIPCRHRTAHPHPFIDLFLHFLVFKECLERGHLSSTPGWDNCRTSTRKCDPDDCGLEYHISFVKLGENRRAFIASIFQDFGQGEEPRSYDQAMRAPVKVEGNFVLCCNERTCLRLNEAKYTDGIERGNRHNKPLNPLELEIRDTLKIMPRSWCEEKPRKPHLFKNHYRSSPIAELHYRELYYLWCVRLFGRKTVTKVELNRFVNQNFGCRIPLPAARPTSWIRRMRLRDERWTRWTTSSNRLRDLPSRRLKKRTRPI